MFRISITFSILTDVLAGIYYKPRPLKEFERSLLIVAHNSVFFFLNTQASVLCPVFPLAHLPHHPAMPPPPKPLHWPLAAFPHQILWLASCLKWISPPRTSWMFSQKNRLTAPTCRVGRITCTLLISNLFVKMEDGGNLFEPVVILILIKSLSCRFVFSPFISSFRCSHHSRPCSVFICLFFIFSCHHSCSNLHHNNPDNSEGPKAHRQQFQARVWARERERVGEGKREGKRKRKGTS